MKINKNKLNEVAAPQSKKQKVYKPKKKVAQHLRVFSSFFRVSSLLTQPLLLLFEGTCRLRVCQGLLHPQAFQQVSTSSVAGSWMRSRLIRKVQVPLPKVVGIGIEVILTTCPDPFNTKLLKEIFDLPPAGGNV